MGKIYLVIKIPPGLRQAGEPQRSKRGPTFVKRLGAAYSYCRSCKAVCGRVLACANILVALCTKI